MIRNFPALLPDEILASAYARFATWLGYTQGAALNDELFGDRLAVIATDLPGRLGHFVDALPPADRPTVDTIIDGHTHLPFYAPFLPRERLMAIREDMRGERAAALHRRIGMFRNRNRLVTLHFCPACVAEDRRCHGVCYWHRLHQIPGVLVCPRHGIPLRASAAPVRRRLRRDAYRAAEHDVEGPTTTLIDATHPHLPFLTQLADDAAWLLDQRGLCPGPSTFQVRYLRLLVKHGLARASGGIDLRTVETAFRARYPAPLLTLLECALRADTDNNWVRNLVRAFTHTQHPLHHLLLMRFLDCSPAEFFALPESMPRYFGPGPWPCLNPVGGHEGALRVTRCDVIRVKYGRCRGRFACPDCGHTYDLVSAGEGAPRGRAHVHDYGQVWEAALRTMWADLSVPLSEVAVRLSVAPYTVKKQVLRLGLPLTTHRDGPGRPIDFGALGQQRMRRRETREDRLARHKETWLGARLAYPEMTTRQLLRLYPQVHRYLEWNDPAWFHEHAPAPHQQAQDKGARGDWAARDSALAEGVIQAAAVFRALPGQPVAVTISAIGLHLDKRRELYTNLDRLERTREALEAVVESREDFAVRRIAWCVANLEAAGAVVPRSTLREMAGIKHDRAKAPKVRAALDRAMLGMGGGPVTGTDDLVAPGDDPPTRATD